MGRNKKEFFSIRQVIELTGVSEFTLRGWENRYNAFSPGRTKTGRRQYSIADIKKARLLKELVEKNYKIGDIAHLNHDKLQDLALTGNVATALAEASPYRQFVQKMIDQGVQFHWDEIRLELQKKRKGMDPKEYVITILAPLLAELGHQVAHQHYSIAQEHILSALIKEELVVCRAHDGKNKSKTRMVMTTPEGDIHDMGIQMATTLASLEGITTLYLGPSTPQKDLCETCIRYGATHLLLSSTISEKEGAKNSLYSYVNFLDRNLPEAVTLLLAGRNTLDFQARPSGRPFEIFRTMADFTQKLGSLS